MMTVSSTHKEEPYALGRGSLFTVISRPGGYEVYRLASNMPIIPKNKRMLLQDEFLSLLLSNQNEILKRRMPWTEQKPKGTTFKVQSIGIANPFYIDLIHQCIVAGEQDILLNSKMELLQGAVPSTRSQRGFG